MALSEKEIVSKLNLLAGRMDAQNALLAKKLDDLGDIYVLYGALDGLSLSYSFFKYIFEMHCTNSKLVSADELHDWLISPEGIITAAAISTSFIVFSMLGNYFDEKNKNDFKRWIAILYPYFRDVIKALKNAYKGIKGLLQVTEILGDLDLRALTLSLALPLGFLAVANRLWIRWMRANRKDMMKANAALLEKILNSEELTLENLAEVLGEIQGQSILLRSMAYSASAFGGVIDGLYLYVAFLSLSALSPPALIILSAFSAVYLISCIATRIYEEYDFQQKLIIAQAKVLLAYQGKKLELLFERMQELSLSLAHESGDKALIKEELARTIEFFEDAVVDFQKEQNNLRALLEPSYFISLLVGAKNGLAAYGALSSIMLATGVFLTSFPPALMITIVVLGMALFLSFVIFTLAAHYLNSAKQQEENKVAAPEELDLAEVGKLFDPENQGACKPKSEDFKAAITKGMDIKATVLIRYQEAFEVVRSFFSGLGKGAKDAAFVLSPMEEYGSDGHPHETTGMITHMVFSAILHGTVFGLRADARGFGRPPIDAPPSAKIPKGSRCSDTDIELETYSTTADEDSQEEPNAKEGTEDDCLPFSTLISSAGTFFGVKQNDAPEESSSAEESSSKEKEYKSTRISSNSFFSSKQKHNEHPFTPIEGLVY